MARKKRQIAPEKSRMLPASIMNVKRTHVGCMEKRVSAGETVGVVFSNGMLEEVAGVCRCFAVVAF